jgi:resuscitation-promoting factor RpfB
MIKEHWKTISLSGLFIGIGLIGLWLYFSGPSTKSVQNTILIRATGGIPPVITADRVPSSILLQAGIRISPGDRILVDGQQYQPDQPLPPASSRVVQFIPVSKITIKQGENLTSILSSAPTLGQALWEADYRLTAADRLDPPSETLLVGDVTINLQAAREINVVDRGTTFKIFSSASSVEEALAENGLTLTSLDGSEPAADQPLPDGKPIKIFRNREEIILSEKAIPFENEKNNIAEMEQGKTEIIQAGQTGMEAARERVYYTNDKETSRHAEGAITLREPVKQITNVGTKAVAGAVNMGIDSLNYYRVEQVYATSYSPCRQGYDHCSTGTASGTPLKKGIVAVTQAWYRIFGGTQVYIPGYGIGTVADTGGGIPGKYWIDLGYGEDDFVNWHETVNVYFLNPAPANVPEVLP